MAGSVVDDLLQNGTRDVRKRDGSLVRVTDVWRSKGASARFPGAMRRPRRVPKITHDANRAMAGLMAREEQRRPGRQASGHSRDERKGGPRARNPPSSMFLMSTDCTATSLGTENSMLSDEDSFTSWAMALRALVSSGARASPRLCPSRC